MWLPILMLFLVADGAPVSDSNAAHAADANALPPDYTVSAVAEPGHCRIVIHPNAPWSLKPTTPFEAVLQAAQSVQLGKPALSEKDYLDPKAVDKTLLVSYTASVAANTVGSVDAHVRAALNFFLCTDDVCQRFKHTADCKIVAAP